jgi:hypothetical protein
MPFVGQVTGNPFPLQRRDTRQIRPLTEENGSSIERAEASSFGGEVYLASGARFQEGNLVFVHATKDSDPSIRQQYPQTVKGRVELLGAENVVDLLVIAQTDLETAVSNNEPLTRPQNGRFWPTEKALLVTDELVYGLLPFLDQNNQVVVTWSPDHEFFVMPRQKFTSFCCLYSIKLANTPDRVVAIRSNYERALNYLQNEGAPVRVWPWEMLETALRLRPNSQFTAWLDQQESIREQFAERLFQLEIEPAKKQLAEERALLEQQKSAYAHDVAIARQVLKLDETEAAHNAPAALDPVAEFSGQRQLVKHIQTYVRAKGYYFSEELLANFWTCLKANYLTVLAGISGTGKSKLPQYVGDALGAQVRLIPVKPNWHDSRDLLGFYNPLTQSFQQTRFLQALLDAKKEEDKRLWLIILDEMNLAPVEHYFADFLSLLEQDHDRVEIELDGWDRGTWEKTRNHWRIENDPTRLSQTLQLEPPILMPSNVRIVGTVNIDQTTQMLSDKLLDRTDVIQFERVDFTQLSLEDRWLRAERVAAKRRLLPDQFRQWAAVDGSNIEALKRLDPFSAQLQQLNQTLGQANLHFGFRVLTEVERYMLQVITGDEYLDVNRAFDLQVKQRILPRIRRMVADSESLKATLEASLQQLQGYPDSCEKIEHGFLQQLKQGFVNYWELGS